MDLLKEQTIMLKLLKKGKIPSISGLATGADLTAVVNKVPDVSNLVIKTDYNIKILDINSKYFTTADYNKFLSQTIDVKLKQKGLVDKSAIAGFINNADLDKKSSNISNNKIARQNNKITSISFKLFSS